MNTQLATQTTTVDEWEILKKIIAKGDLADLSPEQQLIYYVGICKRHKLDPLSKPFDFLEWVDRKGRRKVVLYANKECGAQLRLDRDVSIYRIDEIEENDFYKVTAYARTPDGREDLDKGVVYVGGLSGEYYASAIKSAVTQAKRRVTLSICGLGMLDETEVDDVPGARRIEDPDTEAPAPDRKPSSLDQWKAGRALAMRIIDLSTRLKNMGVPEEVIKSWLPAGLTSRKDLDEKQAVEFIENLTIRIRLNNLCAALSDKGVKKGQILEHMPEGVTSLRDLTLPQASRLAADFGVWLSKIGGREDAHPQD